MDRTEKFGYAALAAMLLCLMLGLMGWAVGNALMGASGFFALIPVTITFAIYGRRKGIL